MKRLRTGSSIIEVTIAMILLAAALLSATQLASATVRQQRRADQRGLARREAANLMEHVAAMPWGEVTNEKLQDLSLSSEVEKHLPNGRLEVVVDETAAREAGARLIPARRVALTVAWGAAAGSRVQLVAWRYAPASTEESPDSAESSNSPVETSENPVEKPENEDQE